MSTSIIKLIKLNELVSLYSRRKPKIVLNPEEEYENKEALNALKAEVLENKIIDSMLEKIHKNEVKMTIDEFEKNNK